MKNTYLSLILLFQAAFVTAQQAPLTQCPEYPNIIENIKAEIALENPNFQSALADVEALRACKPSDQKEAKMWQDKIFGMIEAQRDRAREAEEAGRINEAKFKKAAKAEKEAADKSKKLEQDAVISRDSIKDAKSRIDKLLKKQRIAYKRSQSEKLAVSATVLGEEDYTLAIQAAYEAYNAQPGETTAKSLRDLLSLDNLIYSRTYTEFAPFDQFTVSPNGDYFATMYESDVFLWSNDRTTKTKLEHADKDLKNGTITSSDLFFSADNEYLFVYAKYPADQGGKKTQNSSFGRLIYWNVLTGKLIANIPVEKPIEQWYLKDRHDLIATDISKSKVFELDSDRKNLTENGAFSEKKITNIMGFSPEGDKVIGIDNVLSLGVYDLDARLIASIKLQQIGWADEEILCVAASEKTEYIAVQATYGLKVLQVSGDQINQVAYNNNYFGSRNNRNNLRSALLFVDRQTVLSSQGTSSTFEYFSDNFGDDNYMRSIALLPSYIRSSTFAPEKQHLYTVHLSNIVRLWKTNHLKSIDLPKRINNANSFAFNPNGDMLMIGTNDGEVWQYDFDNKTTSKINCPTSDFNTLGFIDEQTLVALDARKHELVAFDTEGNTKDLPKLGIAKIDFLVTNPSKQIFVAADSSGTIVVGNKQKQLYTFITRTQPTCIAVSKDGEFIAVGNSNGTVIRYRIDGSNRLSYPDHSEAVQCISIAPDNKRLLYGFADGTAILASDKGSKKEFEHSSAVWFTAFSPDGKYIATVDNYNNLWIGDSLNNAVFQYKKYVGFNEDPEPYPFAFSPDGNWVVRGGIDGYSGNPVTLLHTPQYIFSPGYLSPVSIQEKIEYQFDIPASEVSTLLKDSIHYSVEDYLRAADYFAERYDLFEEASDLQLIYQLLTKYNTHSQLKDKTIFFFQEQKGLFEEKLQNTNLNDSLRVIYDSIIQGIPAAIAKYAMDPNQSLSTQISYIKYLKILYKNSQNATSLNNLRTKLERLNIPEDEADNLSSWHKLMEIFDYSDVDSNIITIYEKIIHQKLGRQYYQTILDKGSADDFNTGAFWFARHYYDTGNKIYYSYLDTLLTDMEQSYEHRNDLTTSDTYDNILTIARRSMELSEISVQKDLAERYQQNAINLILLYEKSIPTLTKVENVYAGLKDFHGIYKNLKSDTLEVLHLMETCSLRIITLLETIPQPFYSLTDLESRIKDKSSFSSIEDYYFFQQPHTEILNRIGQNALLNQEWEDIYEWAAYFTNKYNETKLSSDLRIANQLWLRLTKPELLEGWELNKLSETKSTIENARYFTKEFEKTKNQILAAIDKAYIKHLKNSDGIQLCELFLSKISNGFDRRNGKTDYSKELIDLGENALSKTARLNTISENDSIIIASTKSRLADVYINYAVDRWKKKKFKEAEQCVDRSIDLGNATKSDAPLIVMITYILSGNEKKADLYFNNTFFIRGVDDELRETIDSRFTKLTNKQKILFQKYIDLSTSGGK